MASAATFELHVLTASGRLGPHLGAIEEQIAAAFDKAGAKLELSGEAVDVVVRDAAAITIPEIGIGGVAPDAHTIFISLDPTHPRFDHTIGNGLARTIAHEVHHVARRRAGRRGNTLWAAFVHEGLADRFCAELYGGEPPLWSFAPGATLDALTALAIAERDSESYDHGIWFFGKDQATVPRWAGYAMGWRVVGAYLERHPGAQPSRLVDVPADAFDVPQLTCAPTKARPRVCRVSPSCDKPNLA